MRKIFIVIKLVSIMLTVLFVHAISTQATPLIYTVNTDNSHLVQVDLSGNITDIGYLGFDVVNTNPTAAMDLAVLDGKLYGLYTDPWNQVVLHEINPLTGASIASVQLFNPDTLNAILHAEGLATIGGTLKIAYSDYDPSLDPPTSGKKYNSRVLADLALNGTISNASSPGSFDYDGLGSNRAGTEMYGLDVINSNQGYPDQHTDFIGLTNSFATTLDYPAADNPNDVISIGTSLLIIDDTAGTNGRLYLMDLGTGALTNSVDIKGSGRYTGLAIQPVPEPTTVALLGIGLVGLAGAEVRRRRKKKAVDKS